MSKSNNIQTYAKYYYSLPESERDINEWVPILSPLIYSICRRYYFTMDDNDERIQQAWVAATKAIASYNINSGTLLSSYIGVCVTNEMKMRVRWEVKRPKYLLNSIDETVKDVKTDIDCPTIMDTLGDVDGNYNILEIYMTIDSIRHLLTPNETKLIDLILTYVKNDEYFTRVALGKQLGWSPVFVGRLLQHIFKIYKEAI